uniref:Uncharacterized protein n=1 Tax=Anguilla anguilla TaxID=7936 RepID=A0A0E9VE49_ANGAN
MYVQIGAVSTSLLKKNVLIYFYFISSGLKTHFTELKKQECLSVFPTSNESYPSYQAG